MKPLLLTFDVEEFDWPVERGGCLDRSEQMRVTDDGVRALLPLLAKRATRGTFFVTGGFAATRPQTVRAIAEGGHEIAVHGLEHKDDYGHMSAAVAVERLEHARRIVESTTERPAQGIRTPRLLPCPPEICRAAGFTYDATPHPTWVPGRYNGLRWRRAPWREGGLLRVPISVVPGMRLPVSWIWFRWCGPRVGTAAARAAAVGAPYLHLYFHPWEAVPLARFGIPPWLALRTGAAFVRGLDHLLSSLPPHMPPMTIGEFIQRHCDA